MKKLLSIIVSVSVLCSLFSMASVSSATTVSINKAALVMSAPFDDGAINVNTANAAKEMFEVNNIATSTYVNTDGTNAAFLNKISTYFSNAEENDISYIFINAHGYTDAQGIDVGDGVLTYSSIKEQLDNISGKKVVFLASCYSGRIVQQSASSTTDISIESDVVSSQDILTAFLGLDDISVNSGEFSGDSDYIVYCSSMYDQPSYLVPNCVDFATQAWVAGAGEDKLSDADSNQIITAQEYFDFCNNKLHEMTTIQDMAYYSSSNYSSVFFDSNPLGDVNMDGIVSQADMQVILNYVAGNIALSERQLVLADVNSDGRISIADARLIVYINPTDANADGVIDTQDINILLYNTAYVY